VIADLKPYPAYKDSGTPWLGQVPENWETLPALAAFRPRQVKNAGMAEKTVLSLSYGQIIVKPPEKLRGLVPESFETYQIVNPGNIIVRTTDMQNDHTSLRVGHSQYRGIITSAYMCLETTGRVSGEFGYQFLNAYDRLKIIYGYGSGLRQNLDFSQIKRMPVLIPPPWEQVAIVRFLDHADRRIRRYIRAKQKLIKLLEEQKQAIIHRAVTRGLDLSVPLKPSGLDWLGEIPEHWEVRRNGRIFDQRDQTGSVALPILEVSLKTGVRVRTFDDAIHRQVMSDRDKYKTAACGDIAYNMMRMWQGAVGVVPEDGLVSPAYVVARPLDGADSKYFCYLFRTPGYMAEVDNCSRGIVKDRNRLYWLDFKQMFSLYPPAGEQKEIADAIEVRTNDVARAVRDVQREIDLLREYRTRLIADVVTGKLDVREAAARLPDPAAEEPEESEPPDDAEAVSVDNEDGDGLTDADESGGEDRK
jgi:type I restriction enzyme S subunit